MKSKNGLTAKEIVAIANIGGDKLTSADIADLALQIDEPELDETKRKLLAYKLLPSGAVASTKQKAEMVGVSDRRILQIEAEPKFREICVKHVKRNIGKYIPEVWQALFTNAMYGDTQAQLAILRESEVMSPPTENRKLEHSGEVTTKIDISKEVKKQVDNLVSAIGGVPDALSE